MQPGMFSPSSGARLITLLIAGLPLLGQLPSGQLTGTIYDQAGARLDHAAVTVRNAATSAESATHPNDRGEYRFERLPVGKYSVRVSATGLSTVQINDIFIQANKTANYQRDFTGISIHLNFRGAGVGSTRTARCCSCAALE
jgi:hypothetical protein